ncbi:sulfite exporter TauE/SafE family protein [Neobacillus sp. SAB-20_R2A]|uniref:sulfite exporter TauE/SafE family protein n=1 Tax=Neobacillus sp. SAB-20_R2A TaxID=3120519 RepID=UPI003C6DC4D6
MDISTGLLLLLIGIIAGGYGTIVGAGGGFIFVPVLLMVFHLKPEVAAGSGLVIVLINAISGVVGYARKGQINYRMGMTLAFGALPGSFIGFWLLQLYSSNFFYILFASILVCLGIFLMMKNSSVTLKRKLAISEGDRDGLSLHKAEIESVDIPLVQSKWLLPLGFIMGILSSYLGIGGGWLLVPILIYLFHVSTHQATATSIFSLCIYSSAGVLLHLYYGSFDWMTIIWGGLGVMVGAQLGVILSQKIPGKVVLQMLSVLLIIIGFRMYLN